MIEGFDSAYMRTFNFEPEGVRFLVKIKLYMCTQRIRFSYTVFTGKIKEPEKRARPERNKEQIPLGRTKAGTYITIRLGLAVQYLDPYVPQT